MTDTTSKWVPVRSLPMQSLSRPAASNGVLRKVEEHLEVEEDVDVEDDLDVEVDDIGVEDDNAPIADEVGVDEEDADVTVGGDDTTEAIPTQPETVPVKVAKRESPGGRIVRRGIRIFALTVVAFAVFALFLSGLAQGRSQVGLQRRFRAELASNAAPVGGAIPHGAPVAVMEIRGIGLHEAVVEGSKSSQLRNGPGHVLGTPLPGQPGNAVIAGRRTLYGGPFRRLGSLRPGNRIHLTTGEGSTTYRVTSVDTLGVTDGSFVQDHDDNRLTLFTTDSPWAANGRLVVTATLLGKPLPPTVMQRTLDADGLGLTGERDSAPNLLVWLELLAIAALSATYARSRWSAARVWLVFAPAIALLVWLFFESAVRLLPATL